MKTQIKENKSDSIKKLKESDFSVTKFTKDLSYGKKHEKLVMKSMENFELKTDRMAHKTGNVYVEFQSRGKDSGIRTSKSDTWIFKIPNGRDTHLFSIHIPLTRLKKLVSKDYKVVPGGDRLTSRGYLVPLTDLIGI
jgi:hypothetical protein|tara:strand:+ start:2662 stop:3072 length:411 start_codon:yes stop_codon:yes gene_type:complete